MTNPIIVFLITSGIFSFSTFAMIGVAWCGIILSNF